MKPLFAFADRHTLATGVVSASSGLLAWICNLLHVAAGLAADLGAVIGCAASILTFLLLLHKAWQIFFRRRYRNYLERRRHFRDEPFDEGRLQ